MTFVKNAALSTFWALPIALLVSAAALVLTTCFNLLVFRADPTPLRDATARAFETGALPNHHVYTPDRKIGSLTYNDCLILIMALDQSQPALKKAVTPAILKSKTNPEMDKDACATLHDVVMTSNRDGYETVPYHRYISAFAAPAALLVPSLGVAGYRAVLEALSYALCATMLAASLWFWLRAGREQETQRRKMRSGAILFAMLLVFSGMEFYAQNFSIGLADAVVYILFGILLFGHPLEMSRKQLIVMTSVAFAAISVFEFLTGQIPLALAGGVGIIGLHIARAGDRTRAWARILDFLAAATITVAVIFALKIALATVVFQENVLANFVGQLEVRVGNGSFGLWNLILHLAGRADHIGQGSLTLGLANGLAAVIAFGFGLRLIFKGEGVGFVRRDVAVVLLTSIGIILAWHLVFRNHSTIHSEFMVRNFAWAYAAGWMLLGIGLEARRAPVAAQSFERENTSRS